MRAFPLRLPSGLRYWTVLDDNLVPVEIADRFLRHQRLGKDRAELTTRTYAGSVALYLRWCELSGRRWQDAPGELALFMLWLRYGTADRPELEGVPRVVRGERRVNQVLVAVRAFLRFAVSVGEAPASIIPQLYELADSRDLPAEARPEHGGLTYRLAAHHRLTEPQWPPRRASDEEIVALVAACRSARDRLIVLLMARAGLRRGEVAGLRRSDVHLLPDNAPTGCRVSGAHLHVVRRENSNGAWAKSRRPRVVPLDGMVVQALDQYACERGRCGPAEESDFLLVNLFRGVIGAPMRPDAITELVEALARRAGLERRVSPHMARHAFASNISDAGGSLDEVQELLGHASIVMARHYVQPDTSRLRAAVERVGSPRGEAEAR